MPPEKNENERNVIDRREFNGVIGRLDRGDNSMANNRAMIMNDTDRKLILCNETPITFHSSAFSIDFSRDSDPDASWASARVL